MSFGFDCCCGCDFCIKPPPANIFLYITGIQNSTCTDCDSLNTGNMSPNSSFNNKPVNWVLNYHGINKGNSNYDFSDFTFSEINCWWAVEMPKPFHGNTYFCNRTEQVYLIATLSSNGSPGSLFISVFVCTIQKNLNDSKDFFQKEVIGVAVITQVPADISIQSYPWAKIQCSDQRYESLGDWLFTNADPTCNAPGDLARCDAYFPKAA